MSIPSPSPITSRLKVLKMRTQTNYHSMESESERISYLIAHTKKRQFGSIPHHQIGSLFVNRKELSAAGVYRPPQAGISGSKADGADSIVLNGGYVDDEDYGDVIVYTGHGRQDARGKQVRDQGLRDSGNWALKISYEEHP